MSKLFRQLDRRVLVTFPLAPERQSKWWHVSQRANETFVLGFAFLFTFLAVELMDSMTGPVSLALVWLSPAPMIAGASDQWLSCVAPRSLSPWRSRSIPLPPAHWASASPASSCGTVCASLAVQFRPVHLLPNEFLIL